MIVREARTDAKSQPGGMLAAFDYSFHVVWQKVSIGNACPPPGDLRQVAAGLVRRQFWSTSMFSLKYLVAASALVAALLIAPVSGATATSHGKIHLTPAKATMHVAKKAAKPAAKHITKTAKKTVTKKTAKTPAKKITKTVIKKAPAKTIAKKAAKPATH